GVLADVEGLIERETHRDGLCDSPLCHLLPIDEQGAVSAFPDAASVVLEGEADRVVASRDRLRGGDAELVLRLIGFRISTFGLPAMDQHRPATVRTTQCR